MPADWEHAGAAWGHRARDWATLAEPVFVPSYHTVFARAGLGPGERLLDISCGSGGALRVAAGLGAVVAGQDASAALVDVARTRVPEADLRVGDQDALPWPDGTFDVVTSFNGIWGGAQRAVDEAVRVTRPGGRVALTFWGDPAAMQWLGFVVELQLLSASGHLESAVEHVSIRDPGHVESLLAAAGAVPGERFDLDIVSEWPDDDLAWRAMASSGVAWAAIDHSGEEQARKACLAAIAPSWTEEVGYRLTNRITGIVATVPP